MNKPESHPSEMFSRGTFTLELAADYAVAVSQPRTERLYSASVGLSYYFLDKLAITAAFPGYYVSQDGASTGGGGFDLELRYHFFTRDRFSLFLDGGAGLIETSKAVPEGGTRFNFTPRVGIGGTIGLNDDTLFVAGIHALHLSNAGIDGKDRNPSIDVALQGYVGVIFLLN